MTALLADDELRSSIDRVGRPVLLTVLRAVLADARAGALPAPADGTAGSEATVEAVVVQEVSRRVAALERAQLGRVINATGVVLHTNLGRAALSREAIDAVVAAAGATALELDLATGGRGRRGPYAETVLAALSGADAALVVNNGAAALVLAMTVLAAGREVVVSRGELVEIGGSFRLPDVLGAAGVRLREVGTTNRTHLEDYRRALGPDAGAVLRVHPSNYRVEGFTTRPAARELAALARDAGVPFVHDVGSGVLDRDAAVVAAGLADEPTLVEALQDGAQLVLCSGDKLLGGPQAGILVGRADLVAACRRHPLARALRLDKLRTAALEATLAAHVRDRREELPTWAAILAEPASLRRRAERLAPDLDAEVVATEAVVGGGSAPGAVLASWGLALRGPAERWIRALRDGEPPVVGRIVDDRAVLDLRAVAAPDDDVLRRAVEAARAVRPDGPAPG